MFYATRVEAINAGSITDKHGKILNLVGDLPVKVGDVVFTDGNIVFGHAPKRGSVSLPDEIPSGVPVLSEDLQGYFTLDGKYKKYKIAGKEWITNANKTYRHDQDGISVVVADDEQAQDKDKEQDRENDTLKDELLDAEIVIDEDGTENGCFIAKKIVKRVPDKNAQEDDDSDENGVGNDELEEKKVGQDDYYYYFKDTESFYGETIHTNFTTSIYTAVKNNLPEKATIEQVPLELTFEQADCAKFNDKILKDCTLVIYKNGEKTSEWQLSNVFSALEEHVMQYVDIDIPDHDVKDYIKSRAKIVNFKVLNDGRWEALVEVLCFAERGTFKIHHSGKTEFVYDDFEQIDEWIKIPKDFPWGGSKEQIAEAFNKIGGNVTADMVYANKGLANAIYDAFYTATRPYYLHIYHVGKTPISTTPGDTYYGNYRSTVALSKFLIKITANDIGFNGILTNKKILFEQSDFAFFFMSELEINDILNVASNAVTHSIDKSQYFTYKEKYEHEFFFDSVEKEGWALCNIGRYPIKGEEKKTTTYMSWRTISSYYNSRNWANAPDYDNGYSECVSDFDFPIQDGYYAKIKNRYGLDSWLVDSIYDADDKLVIDCKSFFLQVDTFDWNMSFVPLKQTPKKSSFLFGINNAELYKITKTKIEPEKDEQGQDQEEEMSYKYKTEEVGYDLKNYRLRVLSNMRKARK